MEQWIGTLPNSEVERWIETLSESEENFLTPVADSGTEATTSAEDRTLVEPDSVESSDTEELPTIDVMAEAQILVSEELTASVDIDDFLDEYDVTDVSGRIEDLDSASQKVEQLRTMYRGIHNRLKLLLGDQDYEEKYDAQFKEKIRCVKEYIKSLKLKRNDIIQKGDQLKEDALKIKSQKFSHLKESFASSATELEKLFIIDDSKWLAEKDDDVGKRRDDLPQHLKSVLALESTLMELMDSSTGKDSFDGAKERYDTIIKSKITYVEKLEGQIKTREVDKRKSFNKTKLDIKLTPFKGYGGIDFYTFKSDFEKLYLEDTPTENLPDLLKNNYLIGKKKVGIKKSRH